MSERLTVKGAEIMLDVAVNQLADALFHEHEMMTGIMIRDRINELVTEMLDRWRDD
jgi:hypothetical protein